MKACVLVIDDEKNIREGLGAAFEMDGYDVRLADNGKTGLEYVSKGDVDLVVTDLHMDGMSGEEVLRKIASETPGIPVIVLTGHGSIDAAVDAMRAGAYDFLTKPLNLDHLLMIARRALEGRELSIKHEALRKEIQSSQAVKTMTGKSPQMMRVLDLVKRVAPTKASVLVTGESGVGKELVAQSIHDLSPRHGREMIKVNCAALSPSLLESELFGHEKGAYTGADRMQKGRFELAHESTIFLDEIGEIDPATQVKLLRVIQEKKFERVGGERTISVDVRIIAATNKDLRAEVEAKRFREDLFYRLNVVRIEVPPLRERRDDIPLLIGEFLREFADENGKKINGIDARARSALYSYPWPGNIRELRNCMESAVVMSLGSEIALEDLPPNITERKAASSAAIPVGGTLADAEREIIRATLSQCGGNRTKAAEMLGITRKTLAGKLSRDDSEEESEEK